MLTTSDTSPQSRTRVLDPRVPNPKRAAERTNSRGVLLGLAASVVTLLVAGPLVATALGLSVNSPEPLEPTFGRVVLMSLTASLAAMVPFEVIRTLTQKKVDRDTNEAWSTYGIYVSDAMARLVNRARAEAERDALAHPGNRHERDRRTVHLQRLLKPLAFAAHKESEMLSIHDLSELTPGGSHHQEWLEVYKDAEVHFGEVIAYTWDFPATEPTAA